MEKITLRRTAIGLAIGIALGAGYELGARGVHSINEARALGSEAAVTAAAPSPAPLAAPVGLPDFQSIVTRAGPAVVNSSVEGTVKTSSRVGVPQLDPNDPLSEFFRRFGPRIPIPRNGEQVVRGQGSGFIISPDGLILTNAHVVADASEVTVKLTDKREFKAKVLGMDKPTDIAVLKIDAHNLPTLPLGNPDSAQVGEWVLAIGSPFGFENSVTAGIISAKSRSLPDEGYVPFLQTDVAINPGNSGGPLLNLKGEVVGINSQIYSRSGGYQGLSFAIPINVAAEVKPGTAAKLEVWRKGETKQISVTVGEAQPEKIAANDDNAAAGGKLGLSVRPLSPEEQREAETQGLLVLDTAGAAAKAGIQPGDVILALNGTPVKSVEELRALVAKAEHHVALLIQRDDAKIFVPVNLG